MIELLSALSWISGVIVFCFMALLLLVLAGSSAPSSYDWVLKLMCRLIVRCFPIRVRVEGVSRLDRRTSYLFVSNHVNLLDGFLLYGHLPWMFRGLELESHFSWPIYGWFISKFGNFPVSPGSSARSAAGMRGADRALAAGMSVLVLPEGRRTLTGALGQFGRGAFRIAERTGAQIVPIVIAGAFFVMRKGRWTVRPGTVRMVIGDPIRPAEFPTAGAAGLRDLARDRMLAMLREAGDRGDRPLGRGGPAGRAAPGSPTAG